MKKTILLFMFYFFGNFSYAQNSISNRDNLIKDKVIYLSFESDKIKFFTTGNSAGIEPLKKNHTFALKGNFSNIYFRWLNPLKYNITWKDSTYLDDRDEAVKDFINLFVGQFGSSVSELNNSDLQNMMNKINPQNPEKTKESKIRLYGANKVDFNGYYSLDLMNLYLQLRNNESELDVNEIIQLNSILEALDLLDNLNHTKISDEVDGQFVSLFEIENSDEVNDAVKTSKDKLSGWEAIFKSITSSQEKVMILISNLKIATDPILEIYSKTIVSNFSSEVSDNLNSNKNIVDKFKPCVDIISKSIKNELVNQKGYFLNRDVSFDDGKILETEISICTYEYKKDTKEFVKKATIYSSKIKFKKYDWVIPIVSAGAFYSDTNLKGFGVSTDSNGDLTVSEDDIKKNTVITGLFLNLNFDLGSKYFAPVLQIGIDPTKKRPYLLLGTGFAIPVAKIAITGGPIWTWDATLEKLNVGQVIESTTDLENDIKYQFDVKPKGWYLGLQYNF